MFHNNLTGKTYEPSCGMSFQVLGDIPLMVRRQMSLQPDGSNPHYTRHVKEYLK